MAKQAKWLLAAVLALGSALAENAHGAQVKLAGTAQAQEPTRGQMTDVDRPSQGSQMPGTGGSGVEAEGDEVRREDALESKLRDAERNVTSDTRAAVASLRAAADQLREDAEAAKGTARADLHQTADDVDALAAKLRGKTLASADEVKHEFARIHHDLATYEQHRAKERWAQKDAKGAGRDMQKAAEHLQRGAEFLGQKSADAVEATVRNVRRVGGAMVAGGEYAAKEVSDGIDDLGKSLKRLEQELKPRKHTESPKKARSGQEEQR